MNYRVFVLAFCLSSGPLYAASSHGEGKFFRLFDSNQDSVVTKDELNSAGKTRFEEMDADANGVVSADEFKQHMSKHHQDYKQRRFSMIDVNGDAQISQDEFLAYKRQRAEKRFTAMDADGDGLVSVQEFSSQRSGHHEKSWGHAHKGGNHLFGKLDGDGNSELTLQEALAAWNRWFDRIDVNKDQVVTEEEARQAHHKPYHHPSITK
jgi:Ca2+-binding EF-hand superfamily protein